MTGPRRAWGDGIATVTTDDSPRPGVVLDTWYPSPALGDPGDTEPNRGLNTLVDHDDRRRTRREVVRTEIDLDAPPDGAADAYLRLHLLSHRLVQPNTINLDGIFGSSHRWSPVGTFDA